QDSARPLECPSCLPQLEARQSAKGKPAEVLANYDGKPVKHARKDGGNSSLVDVPMDNVGTESLCPQLADCPECEHHGGDVAGFREPFRVTQPERGHCQCEACVCVEFQRGS